MDFSLIGLVVIVLAWLLQLQVSLRGGKRIDKQFLMLYSLGALLLTLEGFTGTVSTAGLLNLAALFLAVLVWLKTRGA